MSTDEHPEMKPDTRLSGRVRQIHSTRIIERSVWRIEVQLDDHRDQSTVTVWLDTFTDEEGRQIAAKVLEKGTVQIDPLGPVMLGCIPRIAHDLGISYSEQNRRKEEGFDP